MKKPLSFLRTFKQHNQFLLVATLLGGLLIYSLSIRRTLQQRQQYLQTQANIDRAATASKDIAQYSAQLAKLKQTAQQPYDRERLLETVTLFCREHDLLVRSFPEALRVVENGNTIITNQIDLEGAYKDMVALVYLIEQEQRLGSVSSFKCFTEKDRVTKKTKLLGRIILRNLEQ
ncbi:MAG: hypothetical protein AAFP19_04195 [Bacteroidota bacterium]